MTRELSSPEVHDDSARYQKIAKSHSELGEIVAKYREWKEIEKGLEGAKQLFAESDDAEMKQMAHDEQRELESRREAVERDVTLLLVPKDPNDEKNVISKFARGPAETKLRFLPPSFFECIRVTRNRSAGGWKYWKARHLPWAG